MITQRATTFLTPATAPAAVYETFSLTPVTCTSASPDQLCKVKLEYKTDNDCEAGTTSTMKFSKKSMTAALADFLLDEFGVKLEFQDKNGKVIAREGWLCDLEILRYF